MSVKVELAELEQRLAEFGPVAFAVTTGDQGNHVVSVRVEFAGGVLAAGAGRTTASNVSAQPAVTLLWPAVGGDYCLIVDGLAMIEGAGDAAQMLVDPQRAVLHRVADASGSGPSCITVLDQRPR